MLKAAGSPSKKAHGAWASSLVPRGVRHSPGLRGKLPRVAVCVATFFLASFVRAEETHTDPAKLASQLATGEVRARRDASYFLQQLGPKALPALPALIKALDDPDKQVWSNSVASVAAIGPDAKDAIPALLDDLDSRKSRGQRPADRDQTLFRSAYALTRIGAAAIPPLIDALRSEDNGLRIGAARALGGMGPLAKDALPALLDNLGHGDPAVQREVADALGSLGEVALPKLTEALSWKEARQRATAALALRAMGRAASPAAAPMLAQLGKETEASARSAFLTALPRIGTEPSALVPPLVDALKDDSEDIRHAAINSLLTSPAARKQIVQALDRLVRETDPTRSERAAYVLGRLGDVSAPAVPSILEAARRASPPGASYLDALVQIGPPAVQPLLSAVEKSDPATLKADHWAVQTLRKMGGIAIAPLTQGLSHTSPTVRILAARSLAEIGPDAESAAPALRERLDDQDVNVRAAALVALVSVHAPMEQIRKHLEAAFKDPATALRAAAVESVLRLTEGAKDFQQSVAATLRDKDPAVRHAALAVLGPAFPDTTPIVTELLADDAARPAALDALARIGPGAKAAAPQLAALIGGSSKTDRIHALATLGSVGPAGRDAAPAVDAARKDADPTIRAAATTTAALIEPDGGARITGLLAAFDDPDQVVRQAAADILAKSGDRAVDAVPKLLTLVEKDADRALALTALSQLPVRPVPLLLQMLRHNNREVKLLACEKISRVGKSARDIAPDLDELSKSPDEELSRAGRRTLRAIGAR
jgi:HEAT repeat protein